MPDIYEPRMGGSFAPPLDDDKLTAYRKLADKAIPPVREAMTALVEMVETFQQTPRSRMAGSPHPSGAPIAVVPLAKTEVARIDPVVPWAHENEMYAALFDKIDPAKDKALRDAAFHLLWFAVELEKDREPLTADMLGA